MMRRSSRRRHRAFLPAAFSSKDLTSTLCWRRHSVVNYSIGMLIGESCRYLVIDESCHQIAHWWVMSLLGYWWVMSSLAQWWVMSSLAYWWVMSSLAHWLVMLSVLCDTCCPYDESFRHLLQGLCQVFAYLHTHIGIGEVVQSDIMCEWGVTALYHYSLDKITIVPLLRIIFGGSSFTNQSYEYFTYTLDISPLSVRRDDLAMRFFHTLLDPASCLYHLITNKRDNSQIIELRKPAVYEVPFARTNKFRNPFILYALNNYM